MNPPPAYPYPMVFSQKPKKRKNKRKGQNKSNQGKPKPAMPKLAANTIYMTNAQGKLMPVIPGSSFAGQVATQKALSDIYGCTKAVQGFASARLQPNSNVCVYQKNGITVVLDKLSSILNFHMLLSEMPTVAVQSSAAVMDGDVEVTPAYTVNGEVIIGTMVQQNNAQEGMPGLTAGININTLQRYMPCAIKASYEPRHEAAKATFRVSNSTTKIVQIRRQK